MSFGKLYSYAENPRTTAILAVAKENGLDIEFFDTVPANGLSAEYLKLNKLGKVPTFEGADGYVLSECIAIAVYLTSQNEKTTLLGKTKQDYASILRWMSYANSEVLGPIGNWFRPLVGRDPYNKKNIDDAQKAATKAVATFEEHLHTHTYLVGERLTLADLFAVGILGRGFQYFYDKAWRAANPNTTRWYETVYSQPIFTSVAGELKFIDEAIKNIPPKKEAAPKKEQAKKEAPKPKAKAAEEEDDEPQEAPKAKHPLALLPRPTFDLDEWKRQYSNQETREVALPWFWANANFEEYSIWKLDYKYNDELTMTFMTSNLISGFFTRLEASRKFIFGAASVYGVTNDSVVQGAFVIRGNEALPAFDVAPDYESYEFTKLDPTKAEDKEFVDDQWSWDKPIKVGDKTYEWADGKGAGGGPSEDNVTGFLVRSKASKWSKNSVLAVDAGSHLAAITRILEQDFPLVSGTNPADLPFSRNGDHKNGNGNGHSNDDSPSPRTAGVSDLDDEDSDDTASSAGIDLPPITTLETGPFEGLPFPHASARANALHVVREHVSTYLITHPHLDHVSGFVINTAAFHNTSRPKRLAALPFTVNAIKTHLFNNVIWPNLTDEDGGVGLVTFQRLQEGGNIAIGEGHGRGYIEVCDGLSVRGFKVSHGHCMRGPGHVHRGSNANLPEAPGSASIQHSHHHSASINAVTAADAAREGRSHSFSLPSQPGTPLFSGSTTDGSRVNTSAHIQQDQCVIDSSAYFIRTETPSILPTHPPHAREVLIFGDVEPDSLSLSPRTAQVWAEAAPKIAAGILTGVFIECSYNNSQGDAVLYGHLAPRHLLAELQHLADLVRDARHELTKAAEEARKGRKRKRTSNGFLGLADGGGPERERKGRVFSGSMALALDAAANQNPHANAYTSGDDTMTDAAPSPTPFPNRTATAPQTGTATPVGAHSTLGGWQDPSPLRGLKVVIMHVKDTLADGPLVGESIQRELEEGERVLAEGGKGLGCQFVVSKGGGSYWF
ncbi:hypothetical protein BU16DRAFT_574162 [Lophium mytilinum]|uniref:EF1G-domain-containing protein n=1 Tax=Lophium mytilinum TaxID=390894 RepID=A0A6A6QIJ1_9PEZI|nr:hypothetical protein BU16DRAFT_574162 [Lophium mytilinum]